MKKARKTFPLYGAFLSVCEMPVLVVGGGSVAARKCGMLVRCGAQVKVVAREFEDRGFRVSGFQGFKVKKVRREFRLSDLSGCRLVFAATDDEAVNAWICAEAIKRGIWCNCAAPPETGNFFVPATVRRGEFAIAVSTGGASAALAAHWRKRLEKIFGAEWGELVELQARMRSLAKKKIGDAEVRRKVLMKLGAAHWAGKIKKVGKSAVAAGMMAVIARHG